DVSNIKPSEVNTDHGIRVGEDSAPVKVIEFINLACPYCKKWYEESREVLRSYVNNGEVQRVIKLFDKDKASLRKGNVIHHYMNYNVPGQAIEEMDFFFAHQDEWTALDEDEIPAYVEEKRGLVYQPYETEIQGIKDEADRANVVLVPSVFVKDFVFDEQISPQQLQDFINQELEKTK
ncbi:MAG: DsbA family protein, partial [Pisciglobus halotolerans]|nr:DsbA family protein [Pisciglobus halotolerans]